MAGIYKKDALVKHQSRKGFVDGSSKGITKDVKRREFLKTTTTASEFIQVQ
ncbi:MAG: hypothetical protein ACYS32_03320 [Planctomycetota bacterium]|jgi:hypothetical protein